MPVKDAMSKVFTRTFRVRWSEIDANGQVSPDHYLRYLVETAYDWGANNYLGEAESRALNLIWVIRETEFNFFRYLRYNDLFDFSIWMVEWQRVRGRRAFELRLTDHGELVARGNQQIACLDRHTLRPISPPRELIDHFRIENPPEFPALPFPKTSLQPEKAYLSQRRIEWRDLDEYGFVNNAAYISFATEACQKAIGMAWNRSGQLREKGLGIVLQRFYIKYHALANWGDLMNIRVLLTELRDTGGVWQIVMQRSQGGDKIVECYADWNLVELATGETQVIPELLMDALIGRS